MTKKRHKNCFAKIAKCWYLKKNYWMPYLFKKTVSHGSKNINYPQIPIWLVVSTHLKNFCHIGSFPQFLGWTYKICELPPPSHQLVQDLDLSPPNTLRSQCWCAPPKTPTLAMGKMKYLNEKLWVKNGENYSGNVTKNLARINDWMCLTNTLW